MSHDLAVFINSLREYLGLDPLYRDGRSLEEGYYNQPDTDWLPRMADSSRRSKSRGSAMHLTP